MKKGPETLCFSSDSVYLLIDSKHPSMSYLSSAIKYWGYCYLHQQCKDVYKRWKCHWLWPEADDSLGGCWINHYSRDFDNAGWKNNFKKHHRSAGKIRQSQSTPLCQQRRFFWQRQILFKLIAIDLPTQNNFHFLSIWNAICGNFVPNFHVPWSNAQWRVILMRLSLRLLIGLESNLTSQPSSSGPVMWMLSQYSMLTAPNWPQILLCQWSCWNARSPVRGKKITSYSHQSKRRFEYEELLPKCGDESHVWWELWRWCSYSSPLRWRCLLCGLLCGLLVWWTTLCSVAVRNCVVSCGVAKHNVCSVMHVHFCSNAVCTLQFGALCSMHCGALCIVHYAASYARCRPTGVGSGSDGRRFRCSYLTRRLCYDEDALQVMSKVTMLTMMQISVQIWQVTQCKPVAIMFK